MSDSPAIRCRFGKNRIGMKLIIISGKPGKIYDICLCYRSSSSLINLSDHPFPIPFTSNLSHKNLLLF